MGLLVEQVNKSFTGFRAITDLSMEVREGSIFGFLGPNGAGKTTTMRMILDILRPDSGRIMWNGQDVREVPRRYWGSSRRAGAVPEGRGRGRGRGAVALPGSPARIIEVGCAQTPGRVARTLSNHRVSHKKVDELSKGNQQKIQFLATILHDPLILIMDEPFSGLDPINANILKEAFEEMHRRGKTLIFSTHQLEQVEELCQDVVIINKGQTIVQGSVREVKRQHERNVARSKLDNDPDARWLDALEGVQVTKRRQDYIEMQIRANLNPNLIVEEALRHGGIISRFELTEPSLTDIFIEHVNEAARPDAPARLSA